VETSRFCASQKTQPAAKRLFYRILLISYEFPIVERRIEYGSRFR